MTRIIERLSQVSDGYAALFVDLWGCYHNGLEPYPQAVAALTDYRAAGGRVILLTNAPRPAERVKVFLDDMGAPEDSYDGIMSSGSACQRAVASGEYGRAFHYVGPDRDRHMLGDIGLEDHPAEEADAILCTGLPDDRIDPARTFGDAVERWRGLGLTMLCANPDYQVDRGDERLWCAGALARLYEDAGGKVVWFGKPHTPTYDQTFALLAEIAGEEVPKSSVLAIGDGVRTDVAGGIGYGLDTVFITGGLAAEEVHGANGHPAAERLEAFLDNAGWAPDYAMSFLR